ncbi:gallidermin/nisin family lantibiotic [Clostridium beijerinckii]|uniref:gallidermin/nisin family lantibiotic n=1 Tax=Clostridium beijerinckii TaxID=1520 RepID=UPI0009B806E5|nr:gallidermin/nisin family lantibiotic [Clostridium beijerinckii]
MGKLDNFDLDVKIKKDEKRGVKPSVTSYSACTPGCATSLFRTCLTRSCKGC